MMGIILYLDLEGVFLSQLRNILSGLMKVHQKEFL